MIKHGDMTIAVVEQGQIGFAQDKGQPVRDVRRLPHAASTRHTATFLIWQVLLPPGLHQWRSPTMTFERAFDLNNNVIRCACVCFLRHRATAARPTGAV